LPVAIGLHDMPRFANFVGQLNLAASALKTAITETKHSEYELKKASLLLRDGGDTQSAARADAIAGRLEKWREGMEREAASIGRVVDQLQAH